MKRPKTPPSAREAAWLALCDYDARLPPWDGLLHRTVRDLSGPDRGLAAELLTGVLRHRRRLDAVLERATEREAAKAEAAVWNLLRLGAYQLLELRIPDHAAVHETVELAKRRHERAAGFVNAALRQVQRMASGGALPAMPPPVEHSLPDSVHGELSRLLPEEEIASALAALNDPGPLGLRLNPLRGAVEDTRREVERVTESRLEPHPLVPGAWTLSDRTRLDALHPLLDHGAIAVQDPASQLVSLLAGARPGMRVADLCAAPGGKAAHLAALMDNRGVVIATDRDKQRLGAMRENLVRLGCLCVETPDWALAEILLAAPEPDAILIDAPCTGWGTVRHRPDLKWRPRDAAALAATQRQLLAGAAPHLAPGGALVYSVCTFLPVETSETVRAFLGAHPEYRVQDARKVLPAEAHSLVSPEGWVVTWPHRHACDGFFAVRLVRA